MLLDAAGYDEIHTFLIKNIIGKRICSYLRKKSIRKMIIFDNIFSISLRGYSKFHLAAHIFTIRVDQLIEIRIEIFVESNPRSAASERINPTSIWKA